MAYRVIAPPAAEPITLQEAKSHLRVVFDDEDSTIVLLIAAARDALEKRTNRLLMAQTIEFAAPILLGCLVLPTAPLRQVVSVSYTDIDGAPQTADPAGYWVESFAVPAVIEPVYGATWPETAPGSQAIVRAEVGYTTAADVPPALKTWMLLAIGALYQNRESFVTGTIVSPLPDSFMEWFWHPYMVYL